MTKRELSGVRSISLGTEPPLFAGVSGTGTEERRLANGTVVTATIENGKILGYTARDKNGRSLPVTLLQMAPGGPPGSAQDSALAAESCWFCFCDDNHCQCEPATCPDPPD